MKKILWLLVVLAVVVSVGNSLAARRTGGGAGAPTGGGGRGRGAPPPASPTNSYWAISSVDASANLVVIQKGESNITFSVSATTKITVSGKPAKLEEVTSGMKVIGRSMAGGSGNLCNSLSVMPVQQPKTNTKKGPPNNQN